MKRFCKHGHDTVIVGRISGYKSCKGCNRKRNALWVKNNPSKAYISNKNYQLNNEEHFKKYQFEYRSNMENKKKKKYLNHLWYKQNLEKVKKAVSKWQKQNPKKVYISAHKSKLKRLKRVPKFGQNGIKDFYKNCPVGYEIDHKIPLRGKKVSGLHVIWNLQYLTSLQNKRKGNKYQGVFHD